MRINFTQPDLVWRVNQMLNSAGNILHKPRTMAEIKAGECCRVHELGKGRGFRARMVAMGVRPGVLLRIVSGHGNGPRLVELGRQQIMIGSEMLKHIFIHKENLEK